MTLHTSLSFETATGSIDYPFTNDYMFRAILQKDKQVLKALIAALLYLKKESIHDVVITNPIELGAAISDKDFIWDIRVNLNNAQLIDLEMQMSNEYNWPERSISYAARSFDQLNSGEEYKEVLPVHSIGFLNFTLFEDQPEFFATYELRNKKTRHLYSSKFSIHVLDLTRIDLATAEDQNYEIDRWAKLFKAKTWEELRMVAKNNPDLLQASNDLYTVNADEIIRQQARARADAEFWERNKNAKIKRLEDTIVERDNTIAENQKIITENKKMLAEKDAELLRLQKELAKFKANQSSIM